jgi:hypothetical protein
LGANTNYSLIQSWWSTPLYLNSQGNNIILGNSTVKVGIGTTSPAYTLDVAGTIRSTEWIVQAQWWDCKFNPEYKRMSWQEKAEYIKVNKHLPQIDNGVEIEKNGLQVGKTMSGFIWNIEDNALDIIDLQKDNEKLKQKNEELEKRIVALEKKLESK